LNPLKNTPIFSAIPMVMVVKPFGQNDQKEGFGGSENREFRQN